MTDATQTDTSGAQTDNYPMATWGDIEDGFDNLSMPEDAERDDPLTESGVEEWADEMLSQVDNSDFENLRANSGVGSKDNLELLGFYAERGDGRADIPIEHPRLNADQDPDEDTPSGEYEDYKREKKADMGPVQTEGPVRQNAKREGRDRASRINAVSDGEWHPSPDSPPLDREFSDNSVNDKLARVGTVAKNAYRELELNGPADAAELAADSLDHSAGTVSRSLNELRAANLVRKTRHNGREKWKPKHEPRPSSNW